MVKVYVEPGGIVFIIVDWKVNSSPNCIISGVRTSRFLFLSLRTGELP